MPGSLKAKHAKLTQVDPVTSKAVFEVEINRFMEAVADVMLVAHGTLKNTMKGQEIATEYGRELERYFELHKARFEEDYSAFAKYALAGKLASKQELSKLGTELLELVSTGKLYDKIQIKKESDGVSFKASKKTMLMLGILELGNSEIPPMPSWKALLDYVMGLGRGMIQNRGKKALSQAINKVFNEKQRSGYYLDKTAPEKKIR